MKLQDIKVEDWEKFFHPERGAVYIGRHSFISSLFYHAPRAFIQGIYFGYKWCCIWYFTKLTLVGVPAGLYDTILKLKNNKGMVLCDKCYFAGRRHQFLKIVK